MSFKDALLSMYDDCGNNQYPDIRDTIISDGNIFDLYPTHKNEPDRKMIRTIAFLAHEFVKKSYGDSETKYKYEVYLGKEYPKSPHQRNSGILHVIDDNNGDRWMVYVGDIYDSWEQVFYETCHESVHLLNPARKNEQNNIQRLEEGVAVKFAEEMYRKYIAPYTGMPPAVSPVSMKARSQYTKSFDIVRKINNEKLKLIREKFGSFWSVTEKSEFIEIIGDCLTSEETDYILDKFDYGTEM